MCMIKSNYIGPSTLQIVLLVHLSYFVHHQNVCSVCHPSFEILLGLFLRNRSRREGEKLAAVTNALIFGVNNPRLLVTLWRLPANLVRCFQDCSPRTRYELKVIKKTHTYVLRVTVS